MINITIDKVKYKLPNKLSELTVGRYQSIKDLNKEDNVKYFGELLNKLGDVPYDVILKMSAKQVTTIANSLHLMILDYEQPLTKKVVLNGITYKFMNNLDLMRFDQFIDLTEMTDNQSKINDNVHLIAAILYNEVISVKKSKFIWYKFWKKRSKVDVLDDYDTTAVYKRAEIFKQHMSMDVVYGLLVFFSHLKLIYMRNSAAYSNSLTQIAPEPKQ